MYCSRIFTMDENPKNRGRKHVLNKSKYNKNKPKPNLPKPINKSKSLIPNWDRYEEELASVDDYVPSGSDFSLLANAPISKGSHFQFKAEANKIENIGRPTIDTSGLFNIDLNLIGLSLSTIPFNERCGIPKEYFSESQRNIMIQTAKNNERMFEQSLSEDVNSTSRIDSYFPSKKSIGNLMSGEKKAERSSIAGNIFRNEEAKDVVDGESPILRERITKTTSLDREIAELNLNKDSTESNGKRGAQIESAASILETESLQQWLDDVLGD